MKRPSLKTQLRRWLVGGGVKAGQDRFVRLSFDTHNGKFYAVGCHGQSARVRGYREQHERQDAPNLPGQYATGGGAEALAGCHAILREGPLPSRISDLRRS